MAETTERMLSMDFVTLNNGAQMPQLGYGVYQVKNEECERCVLDAITVEMLTNMGKTRIV